MALAAQTWTLSAYTPGAWTDLVAEPAVITTLIIANTGSAQARVQMRRVSGGTTLSTLIPGERLDPGKSYAPDVLRSIGVTGVQKLQVQVDVAGVTFDVTGAA